MQKLINLLVLAAAAVAAPAPQASSSDSVATASSSSAPSSAAEVPPVVSSNPAATSHGPYTGPSPTVTGALSTDVLAQSVAPLPPMPQTYPSDGQLHDPEPAPYTPHGGLGTNGTEPTYTMKSDFDYESLALALYQEWIELDLFHDGLARFSVADFEAAGLTAEDRSLIEFMANQEIGHATLITNMLGAEAPKQCQYNYPYQNVREYIDFCQKLTRFGESGVYGFVNHLDSREVGQLLIQSISTEARQQMIFRQFNGQFPMPVWFEIGLPQSFAWTLLAPYISSCPENQTRLIWQNFPALSILNQPNPAKTDPTVNATDDVTVGSNPLNTTGIADSNLCVNATGDGNNCSPAVTHNKTIPLSYPGRVVNFSWDAAGATVGPNNSYVTASGGLADAPRYALFISQLNATYVPLVNISGNTGSAAQPNMSTYAGDPAVNGTMFIALTSQEIPVTPFNLTMVLPYTYAGPAIYQAG